MQIPNGESLRLAHPRATVSVTGAPGGLRTVAVTPVTAGTYVQGSPCRTRYPDELLALLLRIKGPEYLCDEIARDEDPLYAAVNIEAGLFSYVEPAAFAGKTLLDFGCGCGSSTMILARRLPETAIVGVDLVAESLEVARARAAHYGRLDIEFHVSPSGSSLPAGLGPVDVVVMNAVFEHLLPAERGPLMHLLWATLKPGGLLFIQETPNRLCPVEMHSTGLPLLNYLADGLAHRLARRYSPRIAPDSSWEQLLREGIRGGSVRELLRCLPSEPQPPRLLAPSQRGLRDQADLWFYCSSRRHGESRKQKLARLALKVARRVAGVDFTPELALALRKP
jgi:2-polyprenyl-3-methyl-5-hydroxy-6-metoxy-1,4-benzoquinol methylase